MVSYLIEEKKQINKKIKIKEETKAKVKFKMIKQLYAS